MFESHRPFEIEGHFDGGAAGDGARLGAEGVRQSGTVCARRFGRYHILRVFETHTEEDAAVLRVLAHPAGAAVRVHFQLEHPGGVDLHGEHDTGQQSKYRTSHSLLMRL